MIDSLAIGARQVIESLRQHPGTIAIIGFTGVLLFSSLNWLPLLYISLAVAISAYLIYSGQQKKSKKKAK